LGIAKPDLGDEEIADVVEVLHSGWLTSGPRVQSFQEQLAAYVEAPFVGCLNSCTAGLALALRLSDVGTGDEVLIPANTFVACANVVEHIGATPVFVDCDVRTGLLDLDHAEHLIGPRTRALMVVHIGGRPVDLDAVALLRDRHGIVIVEDAAHAIGARWRGRPIGSWGNLCSFSFHATKNMTTIEGGALVLADEFQAERVERLAQHGLSRSSWSRHGEAGPDQYDVVEPGFKLGMHDISAAIGAHQLRRLDGWIEQREQLARTYDELLAELPLQLPPAPSPDSRHARHLYTVLMAPDVPVRRNEAIVGLRERNIGTSVHFRGIHLHAYYRERYGIAPESLPGATDWSERALTLPLHPGLQESDLVDVANALTAVLRRAPAAL
jgi:dTDP-4-amino-4,6-dideoxygalactose transaminase